MTKKGRPNKYKTNVEPRFNEIAEWCELGATDLEIAKNLNVGITAFKDYKNKYPAFLTLLKNSRKKPVEDIKAAMLKRAKGFQYTETKVVTENIELPDEVIAILEETGISGEKYKLAKLIKTEKTTKTALPDVAAGLILLQHWDKDDKGHTKWSRDPANLELKKEEFELKKEQFEKENW